MAAKHPEVDKHCLHRRAVPVGFWERRIQEADGELEEVLEEVVVLLEEELEYYSSCLIFVLLNTYLDKKYIKIYKR